MTDLAGDILRGAAAIAEELLGNRSKKNRRKIYHLHARRAIPTWIEGGQVTSTRSAIHAHYSEKQRAAMSAVATATNT